MESFKHKSFSGPKSSSNPSFVRDNVEVLVRCIDGLLWHLYARDPVILETARSHLEAMPDVRLRETELPLEFGQ